MCLYFGRKFYRSIKQRRSKKEKRGIEVHKETQEKKPQPPCAHRTQRQLSEKPTEPESSIGQVLGSDIRITEFGTSPEQEVPVEISNDSELNTPCKMCRQEKVLARKYRIRIISGIFLPFALASLDLTIVASALPWIASDFNQISQMNWIVSAFNLCSAAFIPFWGQLADIFGRTTALTIILCLMMIGSALCTGAPTSAFPMLIVGRAIQGLSVAGINVVGKIILADKVSLKENAKNTSVFSMVAGIAYALGPVIGGYLTSSQWRWVFGINLPIVAAALVLLFVILQPVLLGPQPLPELETLGDRSQRFKARITTIDFGGQFLFLSGMILIVLALTWGGATYPWQSVRVIAPLVIGGVLFCCFVAWQSLMVPGRYLARKFPRQKPTMPWKLLSQRNMFLLFYINLASGMATTSVLYFSNIYFTLVQGMTSKNAGVQLLYYTPGIGVGVYSAMFLCNVWPKQTFMPLFLGSVIEATGISVLTWAFHRGHSATIYGMMALAGCGTGLRFMPASLHGIGFFPNNIASVITMVQFAFPFGATLGMTIMNTVFNNKSGLDTTNSSSGSFLNTVNDLPATTQGIVRNSARSAVVWAFIAILPFMWLCVVASLALGNVNITKQRELDEKGEVDYSEVVTKRLFIMELCGRGLRKGDDGQKVDEVHV